MRCLIDAQLPPGLCGWLRDQGIAADHVSEVLGGQTADAKIAEHAAANALVLITKDDDFRLRHPPTGYRLVWLRCGNITTRASLTVRPKRSELPRQMGDNQVARTLFAACIAGLIGLLLPHPALAQDEELVEEEFVYPGDDADDPLYADDEFNADITDEDYDPVEDDAVGVETGLDAIPDVFELYDEDGDSSFDEDFDIDDEEYDESGLFRDELPIIRQPLGQTAGPVALIQPGAPAGQAAAWPGMQGAQAGPNPFARKLLGRLYPQGAGFAGNRGAQPVAAGGSPALTRPSVLSIFSGIYLRDRMTPRSSAAYMVENNGAPFQAAVQYTKNPKTWQPAHKYRAFARQQDWEAKHICGGSMIHEQWILTAAHCLWVISDGHESRAESVMAMGLSVLLGAEDISKPQSGTEYVVDRVIIHGAWDPRNLYRHDIALLHIVQKTARSRLNTISSIGRHAGGDPIHGTDLSVMGWGKSADRGRTLAETALWRADVKMIAATTCREKPNFGNRNGTSIPKIGPGALCAGDTRGKACSGDSGGPLILTNGAPTLVGVVSWTVEDSCGVPTIPNVYTRVASYNNWINAAMATTQRATSKVVYFSE